MSKSSPSLADLPPQAGSALARLGEHLALARVRRSESQRQWAARMGISVPTLIRMERGDASVGMACTPPRCGWWAAPPRWLNWRTRRSM